MIAGQQSDILLLEQKKDKLQLGIGQEVLVSKVMENMNILNLTEQMEGSSIVSYRIQTSKLHTFYILGLEHIDISKCPFESTNKPESERENEKVMKDDNGNEKMMFPMSRGSFENVLKLATESDHTWDVHCLMTDKKGV